VIQGGVNLLEQAEQQEKLLEASAKELEKRKKKESKLKDQLHAKEAEKLDIEEKYATLQEEAAGKTRILKEVWKQFQQAKEEVGCETVNNFRYSRLLIFCVRTTVEPLIVNPLTCLSPTNLLNTPSNFHLPSRSLFRVSMV
jgi:kinesin family protein 3/17